jgi:hypothetical protein
MEQWLALIETAAAGKMAGKCWRLRQTLPIDRQEDDYEKAD